MILGAAHTRHRVRDVVAGPAQAQVPPRQPRTRPVAAAGVALTSWTVADRVTATIALRRVGVPIVHKPGLNR